MVYTGLGGVVEHLNVEQKNRSKNKTTNRSVTEDERHGIDLQVSRVNCRLSCSKTNAGCTYSHHNCWRNSTSGCCCNHCYHCHTLDSIRWSSCNWPCNCKTHLSTPLVSHWVQMAFVQGLGKIIDLQ